MCNKNQLASITDDVVKKATSVLGNKLTSVILYGSYARGDYDGESDIDIMIVADISASELSKITKEFVDFSVDIDLKHDIVLSITLQDKSTYDRYKETYPFFRNIEKEGVDLVA